MDLCLSHVYKLCRGEPDEYMYYKCVLVRYIDKVLIPQIQINWQMMFFI